MTAPQKLRASTMEWCNRNSRPKPSIPTPAVRPEATRWQKPGPMGRNEWANFHKTYQADAMAHNLRLQGGKQKEDSKQIVDKPSLAEVTCLRENRNRLSAPRWQRQKYIPPPPEQFPYRPQIIGQSVPRPEHGRPVERPAVPCCFQHVELENDFWASLRFPVSRKALTARPSKKIYELSRPRQFPLACHCSMYSNYEDQVPRRRKMSPRQWRLHLQRLEFLSKPNPRVLADLMCCCP
ncbi:uncharacterized protein LOC6554030 [Drosophila erecta]|uniref:GG16008 n=1 Tax=Drosophila erecta TaxID=7220 RepID=B3P0C4_DROER|nr:uncharacterized protein LOC6554030 [Drosophila erecta]EDV48498.1 uncharacterized protein Dere_GG16008 [Drosophila erecta]